MAIIENVTRNQSFESLTISGNKKISRNTLLIMSHAFKHLSLIHSLTLNLPQVTDSQLAELIQSLFSTHTHLHILDLSQISFGPRTQGILSGKTIQTNPLILIVRSLDKNAITSIVDQHPDWILLNQN